MTFVFYNSSDQRIRVVAAATDIVFPILALKLKILYKLFQMKSLSIYMMLVVFLASCATSKETRSFAKDINGSWQLKTIVTEGVTGKFKAGVFNEADFNCFVGSTWNFNTQKTLGTYNIPANAVECPMVTRNFKWSIYEAKDQPKIFEFKRLDSALNVIDAASGGYRFTIIELNNSTMQLRSDLSFKGQPANLIYNFIRI